jgi:ankyrin repeat protein
LTFANETPLFLAVTLNNIAIVRALLQMPSINVNLPTVQVFHVTFGVTPLYFAAKSKFTEMCELFVARDDIKENVATVEVVHPLLELHH